MQAFESWHAPAIATLLKGSIETKLVPPAHATAYREGGNYSFLLRHERGNILISRSPCKC